MAKITPLSLKPFKKIKYLYYDAKSTVLKIQAFAKSVLIKIFSNCFFSYRFLMERFYKRRFTKKDGERGYLQLSLNQTNQGDAVNQKIEQRKNVVVTDEKETRTASSIEKEQFIKNFKDVLSQKTEIQIINNKDKKTYDEKISCTEKERKAFAGIFDEGLFALVNKETFKILSWVRVSLKLTCLLPGLIVKGKNIREKRNKKTYKLEKGIHFFKALEIIFSNKQRKSNLQEVLKNNDKTIRDFFNIKILKSLVINPMLNPYVSNKPDGFLPAGFLKNEMYQLLPGFAKSLNINYEKLKSNFDKVVNKEQEWIDFFIFLAKEEPIIEKSDNRKELYEFIKKNKVFRTLEIIFLNKEIMKNILEDKSESIKKLKAIILNSTEDEVNVADKDLVEFSEAMEGVMEIDNKELQEHFNQLKSNNNWDDFLGFLILKIEDKMKIELEKEEQRKRVEQEKVERENTEKEKIVNTRLVKEEKVYNSDTKEVKAKQNRKNKIRKLFKFKKINLNYLFKLRKTSRKKS